MLVAAKVAPTPFCADARGERSCLRSFLLDLAGTLAVTSMGMGWSCVAGIKRWHLRRRPGWRCFRRKPCANLVGNDDGDAFGRRFPS